MSLFSLPALAQMNDDYIQSAYIAFFNRPADVQGMIYWKSYPGNAQDLLTEFSRSEEYLSDFNGRNNIEILTIVYQNLFGRAPDNEGLTYWAGQMGLGWVTIANVAYEVLGGAQSSDFIIITNKVHAANMFTGALNTSEKADAYNNAGSIGLGNAAKEWLSKVNELWSSVDDAGSKLGTLVNDLVAASDGNTGGASIVACFSADRTVNYAITNTSADGANRHTVGPMTYNGQAVIGQKSFYPGGNSDDTVEYLMITSNGVSHIAFVNNGIGMISTRTPEYLYAFLNMQPGQSFDQSYTMTVGGYSAPVKTSITFVGFETITLAGKTFFNVCHFRNHTSVVGNSSDIYADTWQAPGYGTIRSVDNKTNTVMYEYAGDL